MNPLRYAALFIILSLSFYLISGCASLRESEPTPEELYAAGEKAFNKTNYEEAIENWKRVKESFPDLPLMVKAEIGIANAYFLNNEFIESGAAYEDFRKLHPTHELASFALYRQALSSYNLINGIDTDQTPTKNALSLFEKFARQYPKSDYIMRVKEKIADCRGKLAQYEIYVGRFYHKTDYFAPAIGRLEGALANFPDYPGHDETLFYIAKSAIETKQRDKIKSSLERLVREYPKSSYAGQARKILEDYR